ncbi:MAG: PTS sugar transporter subunit IIA [Pseudomonadota bacterium]
MPVEDLMTVEDLIRPESVLSNAQARSKKHCLEILSELLSSTAPDVPNEEIFGRLVERERLGCTGLDKGTAFPHCRIEGLANVSGALIKLAAPIDFDTADGEYVDLVIGLMLPEDLSESHHATIRFVMNLLDDDDLRQRLRDSATSAELYRNLIADGEAADD